ncbi:triple tyrosine motif-containing protein [Colwellia sp. MEBiC06753]
MIISCRQTVFCKANRTWWQFLLPLLLLSSAQAFSATAVDVQDLAKVYSIKQDNNGFIWLAGNHGITRYDGVSSINFSATSANWQTPFTWAHHIESYNNQFIVATENKGSWLFDPNNGQTSPIPINTELNSHYSTLYFNQSFYSYSSKKVYQYQPQTGATKQLLTLNNAAVLINTTTDLFVNAGPQGLYLLIGDKFSQVVTQRVLASLAIEDKLIITTPTELMVLSAGKVIARKSIDESIHGLSQENNSSNFFTISDQGNIKKYQLSELKQVRHHYGKARSSRVKAAYHDTSNVLWLATNVGIETLSESAIKNYPIVFDIANNANEITLIDDQVVIGSFGMGLQSMPNEPPLFPENINQLFTKKALRIMDVLTVNNDLYIATFDGAWHYSTKDNVLKKLSFSGNDKILIKLFYANGLLYIGSNDYGLFIYDVVSMQLVDQISIEDGLIANEVTDIIALEDGNIWIATIDGLSIYNRYSKQIKNIPGKGPSKYISMAFADEKIFAATLGDGVFIYDLQGTLLSIIARGIEFTYSTIINDEIWLGAAFGLYTINPKTHQYTLMPGTEKYSFSGEAHIKGDKAYLAHYGGILSVPVKKPGQFNAKVHVAKTTVSGKEFLLNRQIDVSSSNDVITLDLVSLDYRPGQQKKFQYKINNGTWQKVNGNQLTLTGLASGSYHIEVKATNSLGQWSNNRAFTNIDVAFPWYWTPKIRIIYTVTLVCLISLILWLIYLRAQSIRNIHLLLADEIKTKGKRDLSARRNINQTLKLLEDGDIDNAKTLLAQSLESIEKESNTELPDGLYGNTLDVALPYFADYLQHKYHVHLTFEYDLKQNTLSYELQSNLYKIIYEAVICAVVNGDGGKFHVTIQEFKEKLWLTISDDETSFSHFNNKITFNMSMYYIRQIANKYNATFNTFEPTDDKGSQLVISFPSLNAF